MHPIGTPSGIEPADQFAAGWPSSGYSAILNARIRAFQDNYMYLWKQKKKLQMTCAAHSNVDLNESQ